MVPSKLDPTGHERQSGDALILYFSIVVVLAVTAPGDDIPSKCPPYLMPFPQCPIGVLAFVVKCSEPPVSQAEGCVDQLQDTSFQRPILVTPHTLPQQQREPMLCTAAKDIDLLYNLVHVLNPIADCNRQGRVVSAGLMNRPVQFRSNENLRKQASALKSVLRSTSAFTVFQNLDQATLYPRDLFQLQLERFVLFRHKQLPAQGEFQKRHAFVN